MATSCPCDTPLKSAHFEPILKRNGPKLHELWPKWYVLAESDFVWHLIIVFFGVLEGLYCHKNFIGNNYTPYTIVYNRFYPIYLGKIPVLLTNAKVVERLAWTDLNWFFWYFQTRQPVAVPVHPKIAKKPDWTEPLFTTDTSIVCHQMKMKVSLHSPFHSQHFYK